METLKNAGFETVKNAGWKRLKMWVGNGKKCGTVNPRSKPGMIRLK
jgi:hypothetical protein